MTRELQAQNYEVGRKKVRGVMRKLSLKAIQPRSFVPKTTQPTPDQVRKPNLLLEREPLCTEIRQVLVGDITYWPAAAQWYYLSIWMDLFTRRILGWREADYMQAVLVIQSFE